MRRKDKLIEDKKIIKKILTNSKICRIGLFDKNHPYIVPMNYGYSNDSLYFHCAPDGKKIDLIKRNNKVCFEIEHSHEIVKKEVSCNWTTKYLSVIGYGAIEIIYDTDEKKNGLNIIMKHHGKKENIYDDKLVNKVVILKLNISSLTAKQSGDY